MRAYNTEVPIMAYAVYPRARTQALEDLIQILLENGGELELGDAVQQLSSQNRSLVLHYGAFEFVDSHPELFKCEEVRTLRKHKSKVVIILNVPLEFCFEAVEKGGCVTRKCTRLHLCPFFIKGNCKFGATCNRSHSYGDEHTVRVLNHFRLGFLCSSSLLQEVLERIVEESELQRTAAKRSVPDICKFYNKGTCMKEDNCPWLHVCEYFVAGKCKFGDGCKRDHDFSEPHNFRILEEYDMERIADWKVIQLLNGQERKNEMSRSFDSQTPHEGSLSSANFSASYVNLKDDNERDTEICGFNLRSKCNYGNSCIHRHTELPYLWEFTANGRNWESFPSDVNTGLEQLYCNVQNDIFSMRMRGILYRVQFTDMTAVPVPPAGLRPWSAVNSKPFKIRRLSTVSSVVAAAGHVFSTRWHWYWQDENNKWQSYDTPTGAHAVNTTSSQCLEREYMAGNDCHSFTVLHQRYTLYFKGWYQQNDVYKTKRPVRRRPADFVTKGNMHDVAQRRRTAAQVQSRRNSASTELDGPPSHWCPVPDGKDYICVPLNPMHFEYKKAEKFFRETMRDVLPNILKIERVQNPDLWTFYNQKKNRMAKKAGTASEERYLFHGTKPDTIDAICQQGFDWRMCGKHGTKYGKGSYFACSAYYSHHYTANQDTPRSYKHMFLARVLLGSYTNGDSSLTRPPPKDPTNPNILFDSCCDNKSNPALFVVFENGQSYPEFLITYI